MSNYTKLWSCLVSSSIWNESDKTRLVWITLLAIKESDGIARTSVGGLAHLARVSMEDCKEAVNILSGPDTDSRSSNDEGRRIKKVDGGFLIINSEKYMLGKSKSERNKYMKQYRDSESMPQSERDELKESLNELIQRINNIFHRRQTTKWSDRELKALREFNKNVEWSDSDFKAVEKLYQDPRYSYQRRDVQTFVNNLRGELDRARQYMQDHKAFLRI